VTAVEPIPAAQFVEILENAVSRIEAGTGNRVGGGTGRFAQVAGVRFSFDPRRQAIDFGPSTGTEILPVTRVGSRVREVVLADGTVILAGGVLQGGAPDVRIITVDFTAAGGDEYPFRGASFERLGVSYQRSLQNFIAGLPSGVTEAEYPEGGEGRIVNLEFGGLIAQKSIADVSAPFGVTDTTDLFGFIDGYLVQSTLGDVAEPFGVFNIVDVLEYVRAFASDLDAQADR